MNHNYIHINIEKKTRNSFENNDLSIKKYGRSQSIKRLTAIVNLIKTNGPTRLYALLDHYSQLILLLSALELSFENTNEKANYDDDRIKTKAIIA